MDRAIIIVFDSVGCGELPDAARFGDQGSDTLGNLARSVGGLDLPTLRALGLGNIHPIMGVDPVSRPLGAFGKMAEQSNGKDTTLGHWEIAGLVTEKPLPTYPDGFPPEVVTAFESAVGRKTLGNYPESGTVIIDRLGEEHQRTGYPIIYTSADSVFQIAAHEETIPIEEQYRMCRIARELLKGDHAVGRVIARPFIGIPGHYTRTERRHDFSLLPPGDTLLDVMKAAGWPVHGVGKIEDIFAGRGLTSAVHIRDNQDGLEQTLAALGEIPRGLIFTNLVDFDMKFGHRNDTTGYAAALAQADAFLPRLMDQLKETDLLILTADHGCDPTTPSTDHSREYVPLLVYGPARAGGADLGVRRSFADISATLAEMFSLKWSPPGKSFLGDLG